jgi:two-component system cell cycle response regulator DivK
LAPPPLILLVDDFPDALEMYKEYLLYRGYRVATAENGFEALAAAATERPDVIMMDVRMPTLSGSEAMRILRSQPLFSSVPIVALTAHAMADERRQMLLDGFDDVIPKPCLPDELVAAIERLLQFTRFATG